ncbi:MAG TPA: hypothetical protein VEH52_08680 [Gaiellaceae bacterium]|nr:hypothetical protein [Gaiellaceae bacterium]
MKANRPARLCCRPIALRSGFQRLPAACDHELEELEVPPQTAGNGAAGSGIQTRRMLSLRRQPATRFRRGARVG